ncbi:hypothetical protein [Paenibacillus amylolyticus]
MKLDTGQIWLRMPFQSHSVWSAWIEIHAWAGEGGIIEVALRMECVD